MESILELITHKNIDKERWDSLVSNNDSSQLFMYSWYLDVVSPNWSALIYKDYEAIFPITEIKKFGTKQIIQPIFTREFNVVGKGVDNQDVFNHLKANYQNISLRFNLEMPQFSPHSRIAQFVKLNEDFSGNYSTNAKRLIKKAQKHFVYKSIPDVSALMAMVKDILVEKIEEFTPDNLLVLEGLMEKALEQEQGQCIAIFQDGNFVGAGFFLMANDRVTYLKGVANHEAKRLGAMYGLMHYAFNKYSLNFNVFDFGGSNVSNVAQFYKKFGAYDYTYYNYELNQLPFWYKLSKKLLKK
ncbi:hypothetical protein DNU06_01050 [Putridiphycobacter roseus]|uniref:BioF2-like acetyltransferase domain-containing protein n=1 Tax=Putridiphycobacter roseus TaxID=2219161 RepID=A0A2W1NS31_9FLAO|nr:GNAT family N-acetyltransferase [Putridiphycobacter roseus]PZE18452.1 hypothetical protein DNU06_01050 [Putridiphycobacter roseus]